MSAGQALSPRRPRWPTRTGAGSGSGVPQEGAPGAGCCLTAALSASGFSERLVESSGGSPGPPPVGGASDLPSERAVLFI